MRRSILIVWSWLAILSLVACAPSSASNVRATYKASGVKGDSRLTFTPSGDTLLIDITSPTGIGSAVIEKTAGQWSDKIVLRLHVKGLERFTLQYGGGTIELMISSQDDHTIREFYTQPGKLNTISAGDAYWIGVTQGEGYFDLQAPADFLKSGENKLTIEWIDFYR